MENRPGDASARADKTASVHSLQSNETPARRSTTRRSRSRNADWRRVREIAARARAARTTLVHFLQSNELPARRSTPKRTRSRIFSKERNLSRVYAVSHFQSR